MIVYKECWLYCTALFPLSEGELSASSCTSNVCGVSAECCASISNSRARSWKNDVPTGPFFSKQTAGVRLRLGLISGVTSAVPELK